MYKVFIENREVNFRNQSSTLQSNGVIYAKSNESFEKTLLNRILETPENTVVTVLCDSVKKVWKNVLSDCKFIQAAGGIVQREDEFLFIERNNLWDKLIFYLTFVGGFIISFLVLKNILIKINVTDDRLTVNCSPRTTSRRKLLTND